MRKLAIVFSVVLALTSTAFADDIPQPVRVVSNILGLSESQVAQWLELLRAREAAVQPLQRQLQAKREALGALLESPTPDPATAGSLLIEVHAIEKQIAGIAMRTTAQFQETLTPDQKERLQHLREASRVCPIVPALQATGLI